MENAKKRGMSRGCLISLIIVGVLFLIVVIAGVTCWFYKDDLAKMAAVTGLNGINQGLVENPVEGMDTTQFNAISDAFLERLDREDPLDYEKYGMFMQSLQPIFSDQQIDARDVELAVEAMLNYYPDLGSYQVFPETELLEAEGQEAEPPEDTLGSE